MAIIIEESENLKLERIATVRCSRGEEYLINVDQAICAMAELFSEYRNEKRNGWELETPWFEQELNRLSVLSNGTPS